MFRWAVRAVVALLRDGFNRPGVHSQAGASTYVIVTMKKKYYCRCERHRWHRCAMALA